MTQHLRDRQTLFCAPKLMNKIYVSSTTAKVTVKLMAHKCLLARDLFRASMRNEHKGVAGARLTTD